MPTQARTKTATAASRIRAAMAAHDDAATLLPYRSVKVSPMGKRLWLTVPTYNESENIERLVAAVLPELERIAPGEHCLLVVDDNSPDGTGDIADRLATEHEGVEVLHRKGKDGLGPAYLAGFERALAGGAELVAVMDCDLSHDPRSLPDLVAAAEQGADLVIGSRHLPRGGLQGRP